MVNQNEFVKKNVEIEIRKGSKAGWFEVMLGGKKFVMKKVDKFYSEQESVEDIVGQ